MGLRRAAIGCVVALIAVISAPATATVATAGELDTCYFVVTIDESSASPGLGASARKKIAACAKEMQDGSIRAAIRLGKSPTAAEKAWQSAIIKEFVRNGCADTTRDYSTTKPCQVFAEKWPYGYAGKIAKAGTVIVFGFEPI